MVNEGRKSGRCGDEAIRGSAAVWGRCRPSIRHLHPGPHWVAPLMSPWTSRGETPCNHGLPVNEALIGSRHEETLGIKTDNGEEVAEQNGDNYSKVSLLVQLSPGWRCTKEGGLDYPRGQQADSD